MFANWSVAGTAYAEGTLRNIENLIGTSGNDVLAVNTLAGSAKRIDGGAGNDVINALGGSGRLIGGTGSDWVVSYGQSNVLIGGQDDGVPGSDGVRDYFYLGSAPTITDYEVGIDHILIELSYPTEIAAYYDGSALWVDEANGASLYVNGVREVTLANVDAATAGSILFGVVVSPVNNEVWGGAGDDMLWAGGHTTTTRVIVGSGTGDDVIVNFDLALDTLVLEDGVTPVWSNTLVNGAPGLVGTFEGGSVTFQGLTMDDVAAMMIEGNRGSLSATEDPVQSAWSVPSDFPAATLSADIWF